MIYDYIVKSSYECTYLVILLKNEGNSEEEEEEEEEEYIILQICELNSLSIHLKEILLAVPGIQDIWTQEGRGKRQEKKTT
jgi:hypothetical protein